MTRQERDAWVAALRSGEYKQTTGTLRNRKGAMCCLGVYAHVKDPNVWEWDQQERSFKHPLKCEADEYLKSDIIPGSIQTTLCILNDNEGYSFPKIADEIEKIVPIKD